MVSIFDLKDSIIKNIERNIYTRSGLVDIRITVNKNGKVFYIDLFADGVEFLIKDRNDTISKEEYEKMNRIVICKCKYCGENNRYDPLVDRDYYSDGHITKYTCRVCGKLNYTDYAKLLKELRKLKK